MAIIWRLLTSRSAWPGVVLGVSLTLSAVLPASAATFSVDPVSVTLPKSNSSTSVAITNQSGQKLRLEITAFSWQESSAGEMQLKPTEDLIFFPRLLTLDPGETRRVRVGVTIPTGPVEKPFRLFMEELPSLESVVQPRGASVTIRMKVGIPVFVSADGAPAIGGSVRDAVVRNGALSFDVLNTGNTHFSIQQVRVEGKNAAGAGVLSQQLSGWYLLAGGVRRFTIPLSKERCSSLHSLAVAVRTDVTNFANSFTDLDKQCGTVSQR